MQKWFIYIHTHSKYCTAGTFRLEKIFNFLHPGRNVYLVIFFLSCVNDYIAPIVTFTTWVKINSMVMQRVGELVEIFVQ